jgi:hypothetical protein
MRILGYFLLFAAGAAASPDVVSNADAFYQHTEYENSLHALAQDRAPGASNYLLTGKNYFMLGD